MQTIIHHPTIRTTAERTLLYSPSQQRLLSFDQPPVARTAAEPRLQPDRVICHCLQVTESAVQTAISLGMATSVESAGECTGAGTGCTACRRRLAALFTPAPQAQLATS